MVYNCVCAGCNNCSKTEHRVHSFPKDKATLRQWVQFVRVRRADFSIPSVTKNSKVCSAHFTEEDYDQGDVRMVSLGLNRLAQLIPNAVPSVHTHLSACPAPRPRGTKISAASRKRELAMVSLMVMFTSCALASPVYTTYRISFDTASTTVMTHDQSDPRKAHFVLHEYEPKQNCPEVNVQKLVISN